MTAFNVEIFKSALSNGGARPNQFMVELTFPSAAGAGAAGFKSQFLVNIAELPGQTINPAIVQYRGREIKFAGDRIYAPWTTTVLNDSEMSIRAAIERWMGAMEDYQNKAGLLIPSTYQADFSVHQLDRNGLKLRTYRIFSAFPVDLSPVALDFGANDQISQFTCTWQYQYFTVSGIG